MRRGPSGCAASLPQIVELAQEVPDRLDRDGMLGGARDRGQIRRDADIDRQDVVGHRRRSGEQHLLLLAIEPDRLAVDQPRVHGVGQPHQIDVRFVAGIEAGDDTGQHSGIRRLEVARDERDAHTRLGLRAERLEHVHVRMPAADEHDVGLGGHPWIHRISYAAVTAYA